MDRPTGVTILAILNFLGAVLMLGLGALFMLGFSLIGAAAGQTGQEGAGAAMGLLMGLGAVAGVIFLVFAVMALLIGIGLWKLKNWARIVTIILAGLSVLSMLVGVAGSLIAFEPVSLVFNLLFLACYAWILWYMFRPHVKEAFGAG